MKPKITKQEFERRISKIRMYLEKNNIDAILIYGDEYQITGRFLNAVPCCWVEMGNR